jgi:hypothetical protein
MADWNPTDDQLNLEITPVCEDIQYALDALQQSLGCPSSYMAEVIVENIAWRWERQAKQEAAADA